MAEQAPTNKHKSVKLHFDPNPVITVRFSSKFVAEDKLNAINKKIKKHWELQEVDYTLLINDEQIAPRDADKLEKVLQETEPIVTIHVVQNIDNPCTNDDAKNCFEMIVHYDGKSTITYPFPMDRDKWDDDMFQKLKKYTKDKFQIKSEFSLQDKIDDIDDIDDLKDIMDQPQDNISLTNMDLFVKTKNIRNENDCKIDIILISECGSDKINKIMQTHQTLKEIIFKQTQRCIIGQDIESELFQNVMECLNEVRPIAMHEYDELSINPTKIRFWQLYAYLCLITQSVTKCIQLKIAIAPGLYETNELHHDVFIPQYTKLKQIIEQYHALKHNEPQSTFETYCALCDEIRIDPIPTEMIPAKHLDVNDLNICEQNGSSINVTNDKKFNSNALFDVRFYLLSSYKPKTVFVLLPTITDQRFKLSKVSPHNEYLFFIDLCNIPCVYLRKNVVQFECGTKAGFITINPKKGLANKQNVYYWVEEECSKIRKMWDNFKIVSKLPEDENINAQQCVFNQLIQDVHDFKSFRKSDKILCKLKSSISPQTKDLWQQQMVNIMRRHSMISVFKLLLINIYMTEPSWLSIEQVYQIIKACYLDPEQSRMSFKRQRNDEIKHKIGIGIYDCCIGSVQYQFQRNQMQRISSKDYLLSHSVYHFFKHFESIKNSSKQLSFHHYNKGFHYFRGDSEWQKLLIVDILSLDLDIAVSLRITRQYPFECIALVLVKLQTSDQDQYFKNIIQTISRSVQSGIFYRELLKNNATRLFDALDDNFTLVLFLIHCIEERNNDLITNNKEILSSFQKYIQKQIGAMSLRNNNLRPLQKMITAAPQIFDTVETKICLLKNTTLITINEHPHDDDVKQLQTNLRYILKITLHPFDDALRSDLIGFIARTLQDKNCCHLTLPMICKVCLSSKKNIALRSIFKSSLQKAVNTRHFVADRIAMFLNCSAFYEMELGDIYQDFITIVMDGDHKQLNTWSDIHRARVQYLVKRYIGSHRESAIKIWNGIFDKLIEIPSQNVKSIRSNFYFDKEDCNIVDNLKYCFSMEEWVSFAVQNREIRALDHFIVFVVKQLKQLNALLSSKSITMECLELVVGNNIQSLVKTSQFDPHFYYRKMSRMAKRLSEWNVLSTRFKIFLNKFTKHDDGIESEMKTFIDLLNNWNIQIYADIEQRCEWNLFLYTNKTKLQFINSLHESQVFLYIWYKNRDQLEDQCNLDTYFNIVYKDSKNEWDTLAMRASSKQLTLGDKLYFRDSDLMRELRLMKVDTAIATRIQMDIGDSLKLDEYVAFVEDLMKTVYIFVEYGKTQIQNRKGDKWTMLDQKLKIAISRKNDEYQSISNAAHLYREIKDTVNQEYADINKRWIKAVVHCKHTLIKLRTVDGQMVQLSGSLRSVYQELSSIWKRKFDTEIELMRHFALMKPKPNAVNNLLDVANCSEIIVHYDGKSTIRDRDRNRDRDFRYRDFTDRDFDELKQQKDDIQRKCNELNTTNIKLNQDVAQLRHINSALGASNIELGQQNVDIRQTYNDVNVPNIKLNEKNESLKLENDTLRQRNNELGACNIELRQQNDDIKQRYNEVNASNIKLNEECKELQTDLNEMRTKYDQLKRMKNIAETKYIDWNSDDITDWIMSIDPQYEVYENILRKKLKKESVNGSLLVELDKTDMHRFGIISLKHKVAIMKKIKELINKSHHLPQNDEGIHSNDTVYI